MSGSYTSAKQRLSLVQRRRAAHTGPVAPTPLLLRTAGAVWSVQPNWAYNSPQIGPYTTYGRLARIHPDTDDEDAPCEAEEWQFERPTLTRGMPWLMSHRDDTWYVRITAQLSLQGHERPMLGHSHLYSTPERPQGVV